MFSSAPGSGENALIECDLGSRSGLWRVEEGGGFGAVFLAEELKSVQP